MENKLLQFVPFASTLDNSFWHQLTKTKLEISKLEETPIDVWGFYSNVAISGLPPLINLNINSFDYDSKSLGGYSFPVYGQLLIKNTKKAFQDEDKQELNDDCGKIIWDDITSGNSLKNPNLLSKLICLTFPDLKKYIYTYWFAFPALCYPKNISLSKLPVQFSDQFSPKQMTDALTSWDKLDSKDKGYFLLVKTADSATCKPLTEYDILDQENILIGFSDPSNVGQHPGWPLRNFLALVAYHWGTNNKKWNVLCLRNKIVNGVPFYGNSLIFEISFDMDDTTLQPSCVGWEKNEKHKLGPRRVNLSSSMDPEKLSESAVDLNLKLMKWRLVPDINLEAISSAKCLLFGAGTLGCNVARCLIGWGIKNITFVDCGTVSYSNPVRQSLFSFEDCLNGGKMKAAAAAEALKKIVPGINANGFNLSIPMPGHAIPSVLTEQTQKDIEKIIELIENHNIIFLLTDTRESRWLPTVIGVSMKKIVINAALGFDTFMVIRHGVKKNPSEVVVENAGGFKDPIPGEQLGCYFCNDVVAPGDSTKDRTLDQQCTVTRPGVSMIAAAEAVELLVNLLQHPKGGQAPADASSNDNLTAESESLLGMIPHQIRGFMSRFYHILPATMAFSHCPACSPTIIQEYEKNRLSFLFRVFNEAGYLEDISGLKELQNQTDLAEVWELSDSDS